MARPLTRETYAAFGFQLVHAVGQAALAFVAPPTVYPFLAGGGFVLAIAALGFAITDVRSRIETLRTGSRPSPTNVVTPDGGTRIVDDGGSTSTSGRTHDRSATSVMGT